MVSYRTAYRFAFFPLVAPKVYHFILNLMGKEFFASENNLNMLGTKDLIEMMHTIGDTCFSIKDIRFFGLKSNLLLVVRGKGWIQPA